MPFLQLAQEGNSKISEKFQEWGKFEMIISYNVCESDYQGCTAALLQPQTCENALKFPQKFQFLTNCAFKMPILIDMGPP